MPQPVSSIGHWLCPPICMCRLSGHQPRMTMQVPWVGFPYLVQPSEPPVLAETVLLLDHLNASPVTAYQIRTWTRQDPLLSCILGWCRKVGQWARRRRIFSPLHPGVLQYSCKMLYFMEKLGSYTVSRQDHRIWRSFMQAIQGWPAWKFSMNVCIVAADAEPYWREAERLLGVSATPTRPSSWFGWMHTPNG